MSDAGSIVALARRIIDEHLSLSEMPNEIVQLIGPALTHSDLEKAQHVVQDSGCPSREVDLVGMIHASILILTRQANEAGLVHLMTAENLSQRKDRYSLVNAVVHYSQARQHLSKDANNYRAALVNEGNARQSMAKAGLRPTENLQAAIQLYREARPHFASESPDYGQFLLNVANCFLRLAESGELSLKNARRAIHISRKALLNLQPQSPSAGRALLTEGAARNRLAKLGKSPVKNLRRSVRILCRASRCFPPESRSRGLALMNRGNAYWHLAELGLKPTDNARQALKLHRQARSIFSSHPGHAEFNDDIGLTELNEAADRTTLAEFGVEPKRNLHYATRLCSKAAKRFDAESPNWGRAKNTEANARVRKAELRVAPIENLRAAVELYAQARRTFSPRSSSMASALMNEASAYIKLADFVSESLGAQKRAPMRRTRESQYNSEWSRILSGQ